MGRLISRSVFYGDAPDEDASWYAPVHGYGRSRDIDWDATFPHQIFMHHDLLNGQTTEIFHRKREIRRWIEQTLQCPVILFHEDRSYQYYHASIEKLQNYVPLESIYERNHGYYIFRFEELADATLFALRFSDWVTRTPTDDHPDYPESAGFRRHGARRIARWTNRL